MYSVKIKWISAREGGRNSIPSGIEGKYYPVARFPDDIDGPHWSVVFQLKNQKKEEGNLISFGLVDFLMDNAPKDKMEKYDQFEIYEGPKKVADVFIIRK